MKVFIGRYAPHWKAHTFQRWLLEKKHKKHYWDVNEEEYDRLDRVIDKISDLWQDVLNATINNYFMWRDRKIKIRIDRYDTWNMDHTLALIILPMLKQLKKTKHGSPFIEDADVPEHLRSTAAPPLTEQEKSCGISDENFHKRWEWILDEMIWAFEQMIDENSDDQFYSGTADVRFEKVEGTNYSQLVDGPYNTFKVDNEGLKAFHARIDNGTRLFGKYYRGLWD